MPLIVFLVRTIDRLVVLDRLLSLCLATMIVLVATLRRLRRATIKDVPFVYSAERMASTTGPHSLIIRAAGVVVLGAPDLLPRGVAIIHLPLADGIGVVEILDTRRVRSLYLLHLDRASWDKLGSRCAIDSARVVRAKSMRCRLPLHAIFL